jgi:hypothetical protein
VLGVAGTFGIYSAAMLIHFAPLFAAIADMGPESFRMPRWYFVSRDAGALLMIGLAWFVAEKLVALTLSFGLATFFAFSFVLQVNYVCVCLVLGLILFSDRSPSICARAIALVAFALSLPALFLGDPAGPSSSVIWIACVGGGDTDRRTRRIKHNNRATTDASNVCLDRHNNPNANGARSRRSDARIDYC